MKMISKIQKTIVAIGGGSIIKLETLAIDKEIVSLSGKKNPRLLFIPTASGDPENYVKAVKKVYGKKLGCKVDRLLLLREKPDKKEIEDKISSADIIYVGGGNTLKMMKLWRKLGVDRLLRAAYNNGTVLCGISAGAICWFEYGHSDSMSFYHPDDWDYIRVKGLKLLKGILCPHFNGQTRGIKRRKSFSQMIQKIGGSGLAIDNHAAVLFRNNTFRVMSAKKSSRAYKFFRSGGDIVILPIKPMKEFFPFYELYSKKSLIYRKS